MVNKYLDKGFNDFRHWQTLGLWTEGGLFTESPDSREEILNTYSCFVLLPDVYLLRDPWHFSYPSHLHRCVGLQ